jgi:hypothetical protein
MLAFALTSQLIQGLYQPLVALGRVAGHCKEHGVRSLACLKCLILERFMLEVTSDSDYVCWNTPG